MIYISGTKKEKEKNNKTKTKTKTKIILTLVISILFIIICWYLRPESETLTCDQNYLCKVERIRFGNHKETKEFYLSSESYMYIKRHNRIHNVGFMKAGRERVLSVVFTEKQRRYKPFICHTYDHQDYDNAFNDTEKFKQYQLKPEENNFILSSKAGKRIRTSFIPNLIMWIIFCFIILLFG